MVTHIGITPSECNALLNNNLWNVDPHGRSGTPVATDICNIFLATARRVNGKKIIPTSLSLL
jgi:hypothetical protein